MDCVSQHEADGPVVLSTLKGLFLSFKCLYIKNYMNDHEQNFNQMTSESKTHFHHKEDSAC